MLHKIDRECENQCYCRLHHVDGAQCDVVSLADIVGQGCGSKVKV